MLIKEITNKKTWEAFIAKYARGSYPFFQSWTWSEVLVALHLPIQRLGLYDGDNLIGVLLLVEIKAKRGHYFYFRQGPVLHSFNEASFSSFLNYAKGQAKIHRASFIRISRILKNKDIHDDFFSKLGFRDSLLQIIDAQVCPILDISQSDDTILKQMRKSHRYLIKKAKTMPIEITKGASPTDLRVFIMLLKNLSKRKNFIIHSEIEKEFEIFSKYTQCLLLLAKYEGKIISGAFIDFVGNVAFYRHGASDEVFRQIPASYLLQWEAIQESKKRGMKLYNLFGVAPENANKDHPWQGFTLFKTGFGGYNEYYYNVLDLPLTPLYWKNYGIDWVSKMKKGY